MYIISLETIFSQISAVSYFVQSVIAYSINRLVVVIAHRLLFSLWILGFHLVMTLAIKYRSLMQMWPKVIIFYVDN